MYFPPASSQDTGFVAVNSLAAYVASLGSTDFALTGATLTSTTFSGGGGNINSDQVTNGTAAAVVTYTYDAPVGTPEPATFGLIGTAFIGLSVVKFRRRA